MIRIGLGQVSFFYVEFEIKVDRTFVAGIEAVVGVKKIANDGKYPNDEIEITKNF